MDKAYSTQGNPKKSVWIETKTQCKIGKRLPPSYPVPYHQQNQDLLALARKKGYVNNSSYTVASNPCSMLDKGVPTNAPFNFEVVTPDPTKHQVAKIRKGQFQKSYNKSAYTFGGTTNIKKSKSVQMNKLEKRILEKCLQKLKR